MFRGLAGSEQPEPFSTKVSFVLTDDRPFAKWVYDAPPLPPASAAEFGD